MRIIVDRKEMEVGEVIVIINHKVSVQYPNEINGNYFEFKEEKVKK